MIIGKAMLGCVPVGVDVGLGRWRTGFTGGEAGGLIGRERGRRGGTRGGCRG
jgi:hypothetical protein